MQRKIRDFRLDVKEESIQADGAFEGYASVWDELDAYKEVVIPGAFTKSIGKWQSRGRFPPMLWQHRSGEPIGPITALKEDDRGLFIAGQLLIDDVPRAREARALMKSKAITGFSIGFDPIGEEYDSRAGILKLTELDLWEVSVVTFPALESAGVSGIKAFEKLPTPTEFEEFLREAGFSRSQAKAITCHGLSRLLREAEGQKGEIDVPSILQELIPTIATMRSVK